MTAITIAGVLVDILTNRPVAGVHIYQRGPDGITGTTSDAAGLYALQVDADEPVSVSHIGYLPQVWLMNAADAFDPTAPPRVTYLEPAAYDLPEYEVKPPGTDWVGVIGAALSALGLLYAISDDKPKRRR